ncbi:MAG: TonB family protein [Candidatus Tyrphobacter sp.]
MAKKDKEPGKGSYLTTGEKIRNFTGWAFGVAIILELIALPFFHQYGSTEAQATEKPITIIHQTIKPPPTPPPPTPTPPPTPQPHQTPQHVVHQVQQRLLVHAPHQHSSGSGQATQRYIAPKSGSEIGTPQGTATTAPPAPAATPASCANPYRQATVADEAQANYPEAAQELGLGEVTVSVKVTVGASGRLLAETIVQSGHNGEIDREALRVARDSTYAPKLVNCVPTTGEYLFLVTFSPD